MQPMAMVGVMAAFERSAAELEDFDGLVRLYWPKVYRFALASLRDPDAAGSVAQDCLLKAYGARDQFRGECSVAAWLMHIAVNLVRDHARSRRLYFWKRAQASALDVNEVSRSVADQSLTPEGRASAQEQLAAVWTATASLPERQRTVFLLRFVEDMDLLEIAAATGLREGTVKVHLSRALHKIREMLGGTT
jgi:RNA polymerase sigma-70 factor (ECF subfamily)